MYVWANTLDGMSVYVNDEMCERLKAEIIQLLKDNHMSLLQARGILNMVGYELAKMPM